MSQYISIPSLTAKGDMFDIYASFGDDEISQKRYSRRSGFARCSVKVRSDSVGKEKDICMMFSTSGLYFNDLHPWGCMVAHMQPDMALEIAQKLLIAVSKLEVVNAS